VKWIQHLRTINHHKIYVMKHCFRVGLYKQGLLHDLSKYSWVEFRVGAKYYQGDKSPNIVERLENGHSLAWLHHKGRNKHHIEYWIDYSLDSSEGMVGTKMPKKYVVEMFCDRIAASKIYKKDNYVDSDPLDYFLLSKEHYMIHKETKELIEMLLTMLKDKGEEETFHYVKKVVLSDSFYY
jgi:hypothetical protein